VPRQADRAARRLCQGRPLGLPARRVAADLRAELLRRHQADPDRARDPGWWIEAAEIGRYAYEEHAEDDEFVQPRALYRDVMTDTDQEHLITNIVSHVKAGVKPHVVPRVIEYWRSVHPGWAGSKAAEWRLTAH
jgi:catalase